MRLIERIILAMTHTQRLDMDPRLGREYLGSNGINLFHVFDTTSLLDLLRPAIGHVDTDEFPSAVLIANAGAEFWRALEEFGMHGFDPVDYFSSHLATTYATKYLDSDYELLYPSEYPISLRAIADRTGWCHPTPLGITIHHHFGTWYAFRALFLIKARLPASDCSPTNHPCESCIDKPCISACHANAVGEIGSFNLEACARFRIQESSPCSFRCISRIRCPVGSEYQYVPKQMKYHYKRGRDSMVRFYAEHSDQD